jgi:hypothetical protein
MQMTSHFVRPLYVCVKHRSVFYTEYVFQVAPTSTERKHVISTPKPTLHKKIAKSILEPLLTFDDAFFRMTKVSAPAKGFNSSQSLSNHVPYEAVEVQNRVTMPFFFHLKSIKNKKESLWCHTYGNEKVDKGT